MVEILNVSNLSTAFQSDYGSKQALKNISFKINEGEVLALVGESGSGKTVTSLSIMGLLPNNAYIQEGNINLIDKKNNQVNILKLTDEKHNLIRGNDISMVFQEPMTCLNPTMTIGDQIVEVILNHKRISKTKAVKEMIDLLGLVEIPDPTQRAREYPHQLSGGMRQRVMIAIALSCNPKLLIADEPTTALDVTIEAEILNLIQELKSELNMSMLMITHDLGVIGEVTDEVAVMYVGKVVERTSTKKLFSEPLHPYTKALFKSRPRINSSERLSSIDGTVPSPYSQTKGCSFAPRCEVAMDICKNKSPELIDLGEHHVSCWKYNKEEI